MAVVIAYNNIICLVQQLNDTGLRPLETLTGTSSIACSTPFTSNMPAFRGKGKSSSNNRFSLDANAKAAIMADSFLLRRRNSNATVDSRQSNSTNDEMSESSRRRISLDVPWWRSKSGSYINVRATDFIDVGVSRFSSPPANPTLSPNPIVTKPRPPSVEFKKTDTDQAIEVVPPQTFVKPDNERLQRLEDVGLRRIPNHTTDALPADEFIITNANSIDDPTVRNRNSWHERANASGNKPPPVNDILWPRPERPHLVTPAYTGLPPPTAKCFYPSPPPLPTPPLSDQFSLSDRGSFDPDYYYNVRTSITSERLSINSDLIDLRNQLSINSDHVFTEDETASANEHSEIGAQCHRQSETDAEVESEIGHESAPEAEFEIEVEPVIEEQETIVEQIIAAAEAANDKDELRSELVSELMSDLVDELVSEFEPDVESSESEEIEEVEEPAEIELDEAHESETAPYIEKQSACDAREEPEQDTEALKESEAESEAAEPTSPTKSITDTSPNLVDEVEKGSEADTEDEPSTEDKDDETEVKLEEESKSDSVDTSQANVEQVVEDANDSESKTPTKSATNSEVSEKESKSTGKLAKRPSNYNRLREFSRALTPLPTGRKNSRRTLPQMLSRLLDPTETETAPVTPTSPRRRQFGSRRVSKGALARLKSRRPLDTEPPSLESISDENSSRMLNGRPRNSPKVNRAAAARTATTTTTTDASVTSFDFAAVSVASSDEEYVPSRMA